MLSSLHRQLAILAVSSLPAFGLEAPPFPHAVATGVTVELVAQEPEVCTPTAIAADTQGRIWVLQNNTHFRPKDYSGPPTDRVLVLDDFGPDGRARKITTYADGFRDGMGLLLLPDGDVIVSTRAETIRFHDRDGHGHADERRTLLKLTTEATYPHNGLSGIALGPDGFIYLGCGENRGKPWTLTGTDGASVSGSDEGAIFRFDQEGRHLQRWAMGVWNPFGLATDPTGRLLALDNDPGAGSFCRLLHIVQGGDYGYRYRYGSDVEYPFVSWQGRWPGTLPPLSLVAEGPTGLLWVGDSFLGCSWSDFGIQRYRLDRRGASLSTKPEWLVQGDYRFRPTGIARTPDGSLVVSDWVDSAYEVHGKGRIWRIRGYDPKPAPVAPGPEEDKLNALLSGKAPRSAAIALLGSSDPFLRHGALQALAPVVEEILDDKTLAEDPAKRLGILLAARRSHSAQRLSHLSDWLQDSDPAIRRAALQWVAEEPLPDYAQKLDLALQGDVTRMVFEAYVAALDQFAAGKSDADRKASAAQRDARILKIALDDQRGPILRALALHMLQPDYSGLTTAQLHACVAAGAGPLRTEAIRTLATRPDSTAQAELRSLVQSASLKTQDRADAVAGLALSAQGSEETRSLLRSLLPGPDTAVAHEALRSLGPLATADDTAAIPAEPPSAGVPAATLLSAKGDPAAGRRLFFHPNGPACFTCHQVENRGRAVGPDLTHLGGYTPEQILTAIREPSKDIAPAFIQWRVNMKDGTEGYGIDTFKNDTARFYLIDATGKVTAYRHDQVAERTALPVSMMPPGLLDRFSVREVADLLAFLRQQRE
jgi:putative membrane-bound dehydrogenase-like protein